MKRLTIALACAGLAAVPALAGDHQPAATGSGQAATQPRTYAGQMGLYQEPRYGGDDLTFLSPRSVIAIDWPIRSILIHPGERWQICERARFRGECIDPRPLGPRRPRGRHSGLRLGAAGAGGVVKQVPVIPAKAGISLPLRQPERTGRSQLSLG